MNLLKKVFASSVVVLVLLVSSCSSSKDALNNPLVETSGVNPKKVDEIVALLPARFNQSKVLRVASETKYAPAEFIADDDKTPVGYDMELAKAIAQVLGLKVEINQAMFDSIIPALGGKYDLGIAAFSLTEDRAKELNYVTYFKGGISWAVKSDSKIDLKDDSEEPEQFCGLKVGVQIGSQSEDHVDALQNDCLELNKPMEIMRWNAQSDVTTALIGGKIDATIADSSVIGYSVEQASGLIKQTGGVLEWVYNGILINKDDVMLRNAVQKAVQYLIDNGDYERILKFYGAEAGMIKRAEVEVDFENLEFE